MKSISIIVLSLLLFFSCTNSTERKALEIPTGIWRAIILQQGKELPFNFELTKIKSKYSITIHNGAEHIDVSDIVRKDDSLIVKMPFFDSGFKLRYEDGKLTGNFHKYYSDNYVLPITAVQGIGIRFSKASEKTNIGISGKWQVEFVEKDSSAYPAVGIFTQNGGNIEGTFLTETGDYRYLEGNIVDNKLQLSCFDGNHLFLFEGNLIEDKIVDGEFWHGKNTYEKWSAQRNENAKLTNAYELTYLKEGYDKLSFSFPDLDSNMVSLDDVRFKDKVVLVQIFGTWCPNCVDETKFLSKWYDEHQGQDVEIIALAYESKSDFQYAKSRILNLKNRLDVKYPYLIAGTFDKIAAAQTLPMLNHILSFPTLIFINKKGEVHKIHTGFTGPGTGDSYLEFVEEFDIIMDELMTTFPPQG